MTTPPSSSRAMPLPQGAALLAAWGEAVDELVWAWDAETGQVAYANAAFRRFWDRELTELGHGRDALLDHVHPDKAERLRQARRGCTGAGYEETYRVTLPPRNEHAPSRRVRLRERVVSMVDADGRLLVIHIARDISWQFDTTARLQAEISRRTDAERHLSEATQRLEAMIATANDAIITIDERSLVIDWNQAAERIFGWSRQEAMGQLLTELIVPVPYRARHMAGLEQFLRNGTGDIFRRRVETLALRRSGEEFHAELSVWPVRTSTGHTFSSFVRDISRRKAAERALAESEAQYRRVVENVNEGILVTAAGRILYANPRSLELTGQTQESVRSAPFTEFIHPDDRELVLNNHLRRLRGEPVENHYQFRVIHTDGSVRWLEISAVVFEWQNAPATLNFLTDVTHRRQVEQEIRAALARERELSELKSRFVAVASHEFRTPLAAILSSVELLDDYGARLPDAERKDIVGLIKNAVARMNGMVEQVLLTSRLESGQFAFEPAPRPVPSLLVQVASEMDRAHAQASRIALHCERLDQPRWVDAQLVRHILVNLLSNALKYSPTAAPVDCRVRGDGDALHITVTDRGIGIPPSDLPRLFESFHRGGNVGNIQGTGIGLSIVKECVELHHGSIDVDSEPGRGTTFHVRLHAPAAPA